VRRVVIEGEKWVFLVAVAGPGFVKQALATGIDQACPITGSHLPGPFDLHTNEKLQENSRNVLVPQILKR
jgi:hypothetical protein